MLLFGPFREYYENHAILEQRRTKQIDITKTAVTFIKTYVRRFVANKYRKHVCIDLSTTP